MASPFQINQKMGGPSIKPATMRAPAQGGQQNPGYLQMRTPMTPQMPQSKPVITPKPSVGGDTVAPPSMPQANTMPPANRGPNISPPPQAGGNSLGDVYNFFKSDLQNQAKQAKSGAIADASARGVYYGTPLTGSEADIDTQYLRGLGQFQSGMYGNEQQNQLARLGMATNLISGAGANAPAPPGPMDWSGIGALFGNNTPTNPTVAGQRTGPAITPANGKPTNRASGLGITPKDPYSEGN